MPPDQDTGPELRDYLAVLRRRKLTILLTTLVVVGATLVTSFLQTPVYQATAEVVLQPPSSDTLFNASTGQRNDPARAVDTQIRVIKSAPVRDAVRKEFGVVPPVSASGVGQTDVINVSTQSTNPALAADAANAYAKSYIDLSRQKAVDNLLAASEQIQAKVDDLQKEIDALDAQPDPAVRDRGKATRDSLVQQQGTFKERLDQVQVEANLSTGLAQLVTPAAIPSSPIKPTPVRSGILALLVGLVLGVGIAFLRDHLDDSVKTKEDLDRAGRGLPVIGVIPAVGSWKSKEEPRLVSVAEPRSAATEAYRTLRTAIRFLALDRPVGVLLLTSPGAQEGKSTTLANLGVALAGMGQRIVIVCCDLRRPRIHEFFGLDNSVGLTSVLLGETQLSVALQEVKEQPRLSLLASGPLPPNPADLLSSQRIADVLTALRAHADIVLVDSPPVLPVTDALILSGRADAMLLTCLAGETTRKEVDRAMELLRQVDAPLVGTVLNGASEGEPYGYYYRDYQAAPTVIQPTGNGHKEKRGRRAKAAP